jgi:hypothetical protein
MPAARLRRARPTAASGRSSSVGASFWLIDQFWQKLHRKLQPTEPSDSTPVPGMKW